jgi:hypothetical protein
MSMRSSALLALTLIGVFQGCATFSTHLEPRPTAKGRTEFHATADFIAFTEKSGKQQILPDLEIGIRYGLSEKADIGGRLFPFGAELNSRVALLLGDNLDIGIIPGASAAFVTQSSDEAKFLALSFSMPVLFGIALGDSGTLVVGPKLGAQIATQTSSDLEDTEGALTLQPGGVIGVKLVLGENLALFPELNVIYPYSTNNAKFEKPMWQGGLSFQFLL